MVGYNEHADPFVRVYTLCNLGHVKSLHIKIKSDQYLQFSGVFWMLLLVNQVYYYRTWKIITYLFQMFAHSVFPTFLNRPLRNENLHWTIVTKEHCNPHLNHVNKSSELLDMPFIQLPSEDNYFIMFYGMKSQNLNLAYKVLWVTEVACILSPIPPPTPYTGFYLTLLLY